jgi:hypothetical protein
MESVTFYGISVLPENARELVAAIYDQENLTREEAMDIATYLDEKKLNASA